METMKRAISFFMALVLVLGMVPGAALSAAAEAPIEDETPAADEATQTVIDLIDAIGEVSYSMESEAAIGAAYNAYGMLTAEQQALVSNYAVLEAAMNAYMALSSAIVTTETEPVPSPDLLPHPTASVPAIAATTAITINFFNFIITFSSTYEFTILYITFLHNCYHTGVM